MKALRIGCYLMLAAFASIVRADWHTGTVDSVAFAYDGSTVAFILSGYTRNNCTCSAAWGQYACLDRTRTSFKEEFAWLLAARTRGTAISVNLDESTCKAIALYEIGLP